MDKICEIYINKNNQYLLKKIICIYLIKKWSEKYDSQYFGLY